MQVVFSYKIDHCFYFWEISFLIKSTNILEISEKWPKINVIWWKNLWVHNLVLRIVPPIFELPKIRNKKLKELTILKSYPVFLVEVLFLKSLEYSLMDCKGSANPFRCWNSAHRLKLFPPATTRQILTIQIRSQTAFRIQFTAGKTGN